jgi:hypothetical protein
MSNPPRATLIVRSFIAALFLCLGAAAAAILLEEQAPARDATAQAFVTAKAPAASNGPYASEVCQKCRNACVDARERCKVEACKRAGGKPGPSSCSDVKNQKLWVDGLKACSDGEGTCKDQCENGACKRN